MNLLDFVIAPAHAAAAPAAAPKRAKEHRNMLEKLAVGDEVITGGGIAGTVRAIGESFVTVEI
ncbi:preprotein translocase subunit YajC, partial [Luteimonas huabeiensis]|uniref:preprotein translocase subunit YajC n=1 Tax=Luteimonas huabeiensis TaxID=1244513 RepID=UPI0005BE7FC4